MAETLDKAIALASKPRTMGVQPFQRNSDITSYDREPLLAATLDAYQGKRWQFFQQMPGEMKANYQTGEGLERPGHIDVNNLRQWIDTLSNTYGADVSRTFKKDGKRTESKDNPVIEAVIERYKEAEVDRILEHTDADLNLLGNVVLRPIFDEANKELLIHRYQSPSVRVVQNKLNARQPDATILLGVDVDDDNHLHSQAEIWTGTEFVEYRDKTEVARTKLDAPPPLVHCFNRVPDNLTRYWAPCIGPALAHMDLVLNNDLLGPLGYTAVMQGYAQAVIFGVDPSSKYTVGPGRIIQFSGDPDRRQDFQFVTPQAPIPDVLEVLKQMVSMIRAAHGIPEGLLDVKTDATGAAIVQANGPLTEMREKRGKIFRRIERDLLRHTIRVLAGRDERIPLGTDADAYDVSVRYGNPATAMSVADRNEREKHLLEIGVLTAGDIAVQEFPDRWDDADEANDAIKERVAEKQEEANAQLETEAAIVAKHAPEKPPMKKF